ncbi:MAG TPA: glycerol-3-phosphate dehydrogenase C-terminal domain-containing protein, partial [Tepidisphaeraceae bacterium]|nr:glycerol-3-phosphate dehydrogenase C-terminal domain-containing protein [Tepidisphaeraceae bacterium]
RPGRCDILSVFAGIRPLVKEGGATRTAALSREHTIHVSPTGLLSIAGGKWTTYRRMAQDCIDHAATLAELPERACVTESLPIASPAFERGKRLDEALEVYEGEVRFAIRQEMARTLDDVLSRRTRATFLDAKAALRMAPVVARLIAEELRRDGDWQARQMREFDLVAQGFLVKS